jgi:hypothetical protein
MPDNSFYYNKLGFDPPNESSSALDIGNNIPTSNERKLEVSESYLEDFQQQPRAFLEKWGEESPQIILTFLNQDLLENDVENFQYTFELLLREFCFNCDKKISFESLKVVINGRSPQEREEVIQFLKATNLSIQIFKRFEILDMLDKWEELKISVD